MFVVTPYYANQRSIIASGLRPVSISGLLPKYRYRTRSMLPTPPGQMQLRVGCHY